MIRHCIASVFLLSGLAVLSGLAADPESLAPDLVTLRELASLGGDGPGLLRFFSQRTLVEEKRQKIEESIQALGADTYAVREKATADLIAIGVLARPLLKRAINHKDREIRRRARRILDRLETPTDEIPLILAATRVLVYRRPPRTLDTLLAFLPCIEEPEVADEVARAMAPLAMTRENKPDERLVAVLTSRDPVQRFAAGHALARAGSGPRRLTLPLLEDPDPWVRRRMGFTFLEMRDARAVPALISTVAMGGEEAGAAESALHFLAGEHAPLVDLSAAKQVRERAWLAWWKAHGAKLDLDKVDLARLTPGHLLLTTRAVRGLGGSVVQIAPDGRERWRINGLTYPIHASMVRFDRVLICEYSLGRVTERDLKGKILWDKNVGGQPLSAERFADGKTFIATRDKLILLDRAGAELNVINRPHDILSAQRLADGSINVLTSSGNCLRLDATGKQVSSFFTGYVGTSIGFRAHFLPSGGVVVPFYTQSKVREYDARGTVVWELDAYKPSAVVKLPSGNVLVVSRLRNRVNEFNKDGKEVSSMTVDGNPTFIDRR